MANLKVKLIETALLAGVVTFVAGCDSCEDFLGFLFATAPKQTYVVCVENQDGSYSPATTTNPISAVPVPASLAAEFDCGTSVNGQAPLPHPKTSAAIPPAGGTPVSSSPQKRNGNTGSGKDAASPFSLFQTFGYNDGYVPPSVVNPHIPIPTNSTSPSVGLTNCPSNSPDVLIVNHLHNTVTRLGTCPLATKATIPLVSLPLQVAVTPDGTQALVTSFNNAVNFINLATNTVSYTLQTDPSINPAGIAITPDGKHAYVTSFNMTNSALLVIDIASHNILQTIPIGNWPQGVFITPDGSQAWVTYPFQNEVDVFDTLTNTESVSRVVTAPVSVAFNDTGTRAYITSVVTPGAIVTTPGSLVVFDTGSFRQLASYTVGLYPLDVKITPGGRFAVVNNFESANLSVVDTVTGNVVTGTTPSGATFSTGLVPIY